MRRLALLPLLALAGCDEPVGEDVIRSEIGQIAPWVDAVVILDRSIDGGETVFNGTGRVRDGLFDYVQDPEGAELCGTSTEAFRWARGVDGDMRARKVFRQTAAAGDPVTFTGEVAMSVSREGEVGTFGFRPRVNGKAAASVGKAPSFFQHWDARAAITGTPEFDALCERARDRAAE